MIKPAIPLNEEDRLAALDATGLLDSRRDERFDRYTRLMQRLFDVPIALISLVDRDRQWFKSRAGLEATETPRDISFCGHAILKDDVFVIEDTAADPCFSDNPLVTGDPYIRFYAGYPLNIGDGHRIGTLCIIDLKPRQFTDEDYETLRDIGQMVANEISTLQLATVDELTGLSNRRAFTTIASQALAMCVRNSRPASLVVIDMDEFKKINDTLGHAEGDAALREFAELMLGVFRESDFCARIGGDEFCVLMTGAAANQAEHSLARLYKVIATRNSLPGRAFELSFSFGSIEYDTAVHVDIETLMTAADQVMYAHKRSRKNAALSALEKQAELMTSTQRKPESSVCG